MPRHGVPPAADRYRQLPIPSEAHRGQHVSSPGTAGDDGRPALDVPIPDLSGGFEALVARFEHRSQEPCNLHHALRPSDVLT